MLLGCLWDALGTLWNDSWALLVLPGRPKIDFGAAYGCPKPSRARPDASPKRPWAPQPTQNRFFVGFSGIWASFSWIFQRSCVEVRSSRLRRSHKIRISKRSHVILTARLGSCGGQSLHTARTSFEMTFEHYVFSPFSLRTHKPT